MVPLLQKAWSRHPKERPSFANICVFFEDAKEIVANSGVFNTMRKSITAPKKNPSKSSTDDGTSEDEKASPKDASGTPPAADTTTKRKKSLFGF